MKTTRILTPIVASLLLIGGIAIAQPPARNVSKGRHPNLAAAQRLSMQAYERITAAQEANEFDMQGHAKKAKELLDEVNGPPPEGGGFCNGLEALFRLKPAEGYPHQAGFHK